ncbi:hypothetical protein BS101_19840 [Clostridium kluyveri]|uniref:Uncharacterized protein n=1 Tax=Clostridium kluyveri TaxID=1534 RepID=A0A1L5FCQ0_CLOKL|nr:hypothetical protein BS101_19840 [Clostridium kluyveri]
MFSRFKVSIYALIMSIIAIVSSNNSYLYCLFLNYNVNINNIIDILNSYFIKYNIIVILFLIWLDRFNNIEILFITRCTNIFYHMLRNILKYFLYILDYYLYYLIIVSAFFNSQFNIKYGINFFVSSCINALILFLILIVLQLLIHIKNVYIFFIIGIFIFIANSSKIYQSKILSFFYELINNFNYTSIKEIYYIKSIIIVILLLIFMNNILKKTDIL